MQRTPYALKRLLVAAMIRGRTSAGAGQFCACMIAGVGIQPLFQCSCGQPQSLPPRRHLQGFEIRILDGLTASERFDFLDGFVLEVRLEPPFSASPEEAEESAS